MFAKAALGSRCQARIGMYEAEEIAARNIGTGVELLAPSRGAVNDDGA